MATVPRLQRYYQSATTSCPRIAFGSLVSPAGSAGACRFRVRHRRSRRRAGPATGRGLDFHAGNPPSSVLARGQVQDLPGSLATHPVTLRRSTTPDDPLRLAYSGASGAAPTQLTMKASSLHRFRGCTPLHHLLSTLHDGRYRTPCKTRFRLAGCAFAGRESNPLDRDERFQLITSSSPGLSLAQ